MTTASGTRGRLSVTTLVVDGLEVTLTRKRIRRAYLGVHPPDAHVTVSAPLRASDRAVRRLVRDGWEWISRHRQRILEEERRAARPARPRPRARTGESWPILGTEHVLEVDEGAGRIRAHRDAHGRIRLRVPDGTQEHERLAALERLQRRALRDAAWPVIDRWASELQIEPTFLGIRRMRTQWGSCVPSQGRIWLSLELVTRRPELVEYVIVHELLHFFELSHGPRFEALMDTHLPVWRRLRDELDGRDDGHATVDPPG
jgi:predicted metal-dependent hydrolase